MSKTTKKTLAMLIADTLPSSYRALPGHAPLWFALTEAQMAPNAPWPS